MTDLVIRGAATAEELAAVTAVLTARSGSAASEDDYRRWRRIRLAALRAPAAGDEPGRY